MITFKGDRSNSVSFFLQQCRYPHRNDLVSMRIICLLCVLVFLIGAYEVHAQGTVDIFPRNTSRVVIGPDNSTVTLDVLTLTHTIQVAVDGEILDSSGWSFNRNTSTLTIIWQPEWPPFPREALIEWHYRPVSLPRSFQINRPVADQVVDSDSTAQVYRPLVVSDPVFAGNLSGSGSITRGVIVGTNRDLGLESGLRFDLTGYITDDVFITASITDQNTFIQPDGTTQNLREFDQVFIRIQAPRIRAQFGDIDAGFNESRIARLNRRLQGAHAAYGYSEPELGQTSAALAVMRGTYRTVEFSGRDGNQGPYRLTNSSNEPFVVVVAGTERVFLDGRLLDRGDENDYIIDYSIGEIYFTNRRLIRSSHRIRVEYQYLSTGFTRVLTAAETDYHGLFDGRMSVGATFIREADNTSLDDFTGLSQDDIELLRSSSATGGDLVVSGADSVGFRPDTPFVLYVRRDTLIQGQSFSIFVFEPGNPASVFRVQFTLVGEGQGSYRRSFRSINGVVYEWVGPGQGNYDPVRRIRAPESRQIMALRTSIRPTNGFSLASEVAMSGAEANRYAAGSNEYGQMVHSQLQWVGRASDNLTVNLWARHEYRSEAFQFFDPVRDIEFSRLWDIRDDGASSEQLLKAGAGIGTGDHQQVSWTIQHLSRAGSSGLRNDVAVNWDSDSGIDFQLQGGSLQSKRDGGTQTRWQQVRAESGLTRYTSNGSFFRPYYQIDAELREEKLASGAWSPGSFAHLEHIPGVQFVSTSTMNAGVYYAYRTDYIPSTGGELIPGSRIIAPGINVEYTASDWLRSVNRIAYQTRTPIEHDELAADAGRSRGMAVRSSTDIRVFNRALESTLLYDVTTESRSILEETYLEVGPEFGQFVWIDVNGDGIPQVDEFFPEQTPNEGTFIRQLLPTDDLQPVLALQFRWRVTLEPYRYLPLPGVKGVRYTSTLDIREQSETNRFEDIYLLRQGAFRGMSTLAGRLSVDQQIQAFRHRSDLNSFIRYQVTDGLNRLASGIEQENSSIINFFTSYRLSEMFSIQLDSRLAVQRLESEGLFSRNYDIRTYDNDVGFSYHTLSGVRAGLFFGYLSGQDRMSSDPVELSGLRVRSEWSVSFTNRLNFTINTAYRTMNVEGAANATTEFVLTNGAGTGQSWLWGSQLIWTTSNRVRTVLEYNGRTVPGLPAIQTGRMTVTALF